MTVGASFASSPNVFLFHGMMSSVSFVVSIVQMGAMDMQQGMAAGYPVGAGGMVPNMAVSLKVELEGLHVYGNCYALYRPVYKELEIRAPAAS